VAATHTAARLMQERLPRLSNAVVAHLAAHLSEDTRDAVLGDAHELQLPPHQLTLELLWLVTQHQRSAWQHPRAWVALFGISLPSAFAAMGLSVTLWRNLASVEDAHSSGIPWHLAILGIAGIAWAWNCGRSLRTYAPATATIAAVAALLPAIYCLMQFPQGTGSAVSLFLLVPVFLLGSLGRRHSRAAVHPVLTATLLSMIFATLHPTQLWWLGPSWLYALTSRTLPPATAV
jgi:hypothetical protein